MSKRTALDSVFDNPVSRPFGGEVVTRAEVTRPAPDDAVPLTISHRSSDTPAPLRAGSSVDQAALRRTDARIANAALRAHPDDKALLLALPEKINPSKRNVLVLDVFTGDHNASMLSQNDIDSPSHGNLIAQSLVQEGFNVSKAEVHADFGRDVHISDFGQAFNDISAKIESGVLKIGDGDIITASFGNSPRLDTLQDGTRSAAVETGDLTFGEATKHLKLNITAENLRQQIPEIRRRLKLSADGKDPETGRAFEHLELSDRNFQTRARFAVSTNEAIEKLQNRGIIVIHSAGNDGPGRFGLDFLAARFDMSSVGSGVSSTEVADKFSAANSHTTSANGFFPIHLRTSPSLLDPELSIKPLTTQLQLGNKDIFFSSKNASVEPVTVDRSKATPTAGGSRGMLQFETPRSAYEIFSRDASHARVFTPTLTRPFAQIDFKTFSGKVEPADTIVSTTELRGLPDDPVVGLSPGTSFSVIDLLDGKADRSVPL